MITEPTTERVTVAIPFHRGQPYLREAIGSVLAQSTANWELIVCDDAGPELGTDELVESFRDPRVRYVRNPENLGMAGNWNRCLELAQTDLVSLLHHDDRLLPGYVEHMAAAATAAPEVATVHCGTVVIDECGKPAFSFVDGIKHFIRPRREGASTLDGRRGVRALMRGNFIMCPATLYRRSVLGDFRFDTSWQFAPDLDLFTQLLFAGRRLLVIDDDLYEYRRHPDNTTERLTASLHRFEEESLLHDKVARQAVERRWSEVATTARRKGIIKLNLLYRVVQDVGHLRGRAAWRKTQFLWRMTWPGSPYPDRTADLH